MGLIVLLILAVPTIIGVLLDIRLGVWPWGIFGAVLVSITAATYYTVRRTLDAYRRLDGSSTAIQSKPNNSAPSVKEDERA